jgi:hypothetical protein
MKRLFQILMLLASFQTYSQVYTPVNPNRIPTSAFPFQNFTYDARSAALGEAGVAISPDANSAWMNPAKLPFLKQKDSLSKQNKGISIHYTPYYRQLIRGMNLFGANAFQANQKQAFGLVIKYFDAGMTEIRDEKGVFQSNYSTKEYAIKGFYTKRFKQNNGVGIGLNYLYSNLFNKVHAMSGDVYFYHNGQAKGKRIIHWLNHGASLTSIGGKVRYNDFKKRSFQPTLLKVGLAQHFQHKQNVWILTADANKLLVPTPPIRDVNNQVLHGKNEENISGIGSIFQSWTTAPDGFWETLKEIRLSFGVEYQYKDALAIRAGYYAQHQSKGDLHYFTFGIGGKFKGLGLDAAYLLPQKSNQLLANTFRVSLSYLHSK